MSFATTQPSVQFEGICGSLAAVVSVANVVSVNMRVKYRFIICRTTIIVVRAMASTEYLFGISLLELLILRSQK